VVAGSVAAGSVVSGGSVVAVVVSSGAVVAVGDATVMVGSAVAARVRSPATAGSIGPAPTGPRHDRRVPAGERSEAGEGNWWAPALLRRLHRRIAVGHHVDPLDAEANTDEATATAVEPTEPIQPARGGLTS